MFDILQFKSYRLSSLTDKSGAAMERSSLVEGGQVTSETRRGVSGNFVESLVLCSAVISSGDDIVIAHLNSTGTTAV